MKLTISKIILLFVLPLTVVFLIFIGKTNPSPIYMVYACSIPILVLSLYKSELILSLIIFYTLIIEGKIIESNPLFKLFEFNWYIYDLILIVIILSVGQKVFLGKGPKINRTFIYILLLYFIVALISLLNGIINGNGTSNSLFDLRVSIYYLTAIIVPYIIYEGKINYYKYIINNILYFGLIKIVYEIGNSILIGRYYDSNIGEYLDFARITGYTEFTYVILSIIILVKLLFTKQLRDIILLLIFFNISILGLYMTYTRGSWLTFIIGGLFVVIILQYKKVVKINLYYYLSAILVFLGIYGILLISGNEVVLLNRLDIFTSGKIDISNMGRLFEFNSAYATFLESPFLGAGLGFLFDYYAPGIGQVTTIYCHNVFLYVAAKMGSIGLIVFLLLLIYPAIKTYKGAFENTKSNDDVLIFFLLIFMFVIKSLTTWHLYVVTFSPFIGLLLGAALEFNAKKNTKAKYSSNNY